MKKFILHILVALLWPVVANATVTEFNGDGSVTTYEASDYLAKQRHSRKTPEVPALESFRQPKERYGDIVTAASKKYNLAENIIRAVIRAESHFHSESISPKGAQGLMQLMPSTARVYGVTNLFDPEQNINAGTAHLKYLLGRYKGNLRLALAAYNAGEAAVDKYGGVPPYEETRNYIKKITRYMINAGN